MKITRREFSGLVAAAPFIGTVAAAAVANPEVVILGAGAAGLAAAQVLINGGCRVQVIEAAPHIGGRCYTDTATFGTAFDHGASWLYDADRNPLTGYARLHGFHTAVHDPKELLFANGRLVSPKANAAYDRAFDGLSSAIAEAADEESDSSASKIVPPVLDDDASAWLTTAASLIGPLDMGVELEALSVKDWFARDDREPVRMVREGLGTLVARLGGGIPVFVNARASAIAVGAGGIVTVTTNRGPLTAKAVIVTASVGVLASGSIRFDPALGGEHQRGLSGLSMGLVNKIALAFTRKSPALQFPENSVLVPQVGGERGVCFHVKPFGAPMIICMTGGSLAWELSKLSHVERVTYARQRLRTMLGSVADNGFKFGSATDWGNNPVTLGAFAAARPGTPHARDQLAAPISERIFLAGEALAGKAAQTAHGAYESGRTAARRVLTLLKRK